jgi:hypothetical protein
VCFQCDKSWKNLHTLKTNKRKYQIRRVRMSRERRRLYSPSLFVRPSVRMYHLGCHWMDFREIWYWGLLRKSVAKTQILLQSDRHIGEFTKRQKDIYIVKSSTKYVLAVKQCKINQLLLFRVNTDRFYTVDRNAQVSNNTRGLNISSRLCHGYANVPQGYVTSKLPILLRLIFWYLCDLKTASTEGRNVLPTV